MSQNKYKNCFGREIGGYYELKTPKIHVGAARKPKSDKVVRGVEITQL